MPRFPGAQLRLIALERFLIKIVDARIAAALTAILRQRTLGRRRARIVGGGVVVGHRKGKGVIGSLCIGFAGRARAARLWLRMTPRPMRYCAGAAIPPVITSIGPRNSRDESDRQARDL